MQVAEPGLFEHPPRQRDAIQTIAESRNGLSRSKERQMIDWQSERNSVMGTTTVGKIIIGVVIVGVAVIVIVGVMVIVGVNVRVAVGVIVGVNVRVGVRVIVAVAVRVGAPESWRNHPNPGATGGQ